jgi:hypothetical protein
MGGGGKSPQPSQSTTYTSNLPEYARPYFERMMGRAEAESNQPYVSYGGQRLAGFAPDTEQAFDITRNVAARGTPELDIAGGVLGASAMRGLGASGYQAAPIQQTAFGQPQAEQYMSPYMNEVLARQKAAAVRDYDEGRPARDTAAIRAGAFGGYRSAIQEGVAQRGLGERLSDIEATGRQRAYESAQGQFERDRAASMQAQAQTEQQRLAAAQYGLSGAGLGVQAGQALGQIGATRQGLTLQQAQALQQQGGVQQEQSQRELDLAYQDFLNQREYGKQQINFLSSIMRGIPVQPTQVTSRYDNPNPMAQFGGLGIAGLGLLRSA